MEVHAHSHTPRNKWTHYFWEFLMLFLAVFCGFFAEYQLEHKIEKDRAKEMASNFYNELAGDARAVGLAIENRVKKEDALEYLKLYFRDSSIINVSNTFAINFNPGLLSQAPSIFEPRDIILEQLINSGSLRYFKSKEIQKLTGEISVAIDKVKRRNEIEWTFLHENLYPFIIQHNDQNWYDSIGQRGKISFTTALKNYEQSGKIIPFYLNNVENFDRKKAINMIGLYQLIFRGTYRSFYHQYDSLNKQLRSVISTEYKIK